MKLKKESLTHFFFARSTIFIFTDGTVKLASSISLENNGTSEMETNVTSPWKLIYNITQPIATCQVKRGLKMQIKMTLNIYRVVSLHPNNVEAVCSNYDYYF